MTQAFSPAAEKNKKPILKILQEYLQKNDNIFEIGSGTGQHAVYVANSMPFITWQMSDLPDKKADMMAAMLQSEHHNLLNPLTLNVENAQEWPEKKYNIIFTANTMHILSWDEVKRMIQLVSQCLVEKGLFICYGPFNVAGKFTSESNQLFDQTLKEHAPHMGLRCLDNITHMANTLGLSLVTVHEMPANNKTLVFQLN